MPSTMAYCIGALLWMTFPHMVAYVEIGALLENAVNYHRQWGSSIVRDR